MFGIRLKGHYRFKFYGSGFSFQNLAKEEGNSQKGKELFNSSLESLKCDDLKWHSQPKQREKDKKRDRWLRKRGWTIFRFGAEEIKNNTATCVKILKPTIQNLGGLSP